MRLIFINNPDHESTCFRENLWLARPLIKSRVCINPSLVQVARVETAEDDTPEIAILCSCTRRCVFLGVKISLSVPPSLAVVVACNGGALFFPFLPEKGRRMHV